MTKFSTTGDGEQRHDTQVQFHRTKKGDHHWRDGSRCL